MHAFSWLFGHSHTAVNFRVPLCKVTHDTHSVTVDASSAAFGTSGTSGRALDSITGYLRKPQPFGKELQQAAKQLHFLDTSPPKDQAAKHYRQVVHRVFGDLEFRCSVRPITEEYMLAGFCNTTEPTAAECIRTFPVIPFVGNEWLSLLDDWTTPKSSASTCSCIRA